MNPPPRPLVLDAVLNSPPPKAGLLLLASLAPAPWEPWSCCAPQPEDSAGFAAGDFRALAERGRLDVPPTPSVNVGAGRVSSA